MRSPRRRGSVTVRRIVVAADSSAPGRAALEAAVRLASRLEAELEGLFLEDTNLKRLSQLPVAREFRFGGGIRPFGRDAGAVADDMHAEAMRVRRDLEGAAERAHVKATFRIAEGRIEHAVVAAGGDADLLIVGMTRSRALTALRPGTAPVILVNRPLVLYDGTPGADRALDLAARLADDGPAALTVIIRAGTDAEVLRLRRRAAQRLAENDHGARLRVADSPSLVDLCRAVTTFGASVLVIATDDPLLQGKGFQALLDDILCPVLVVR